MPRLAYPNFPVLLDHLDGLSGDPSISLLVSPRTLYILQNAVLGLLRERAFYANTRFGEQYAPVDEDDDGWALYISSLADLERDITEIEMENFTIQLHQGQDISTTIYVARYMIVGDIIIATVLVGASGTGLAGYPITLDSISPDILFPKYAIMVGSGMFYDYGSQFSSVTALAYGACSDKLAFIGDGAANYLGLSPAITIAVNDAFYLNLMYERC
jgi:hypothetical protein